MSSARTSPNLIRRLVIIGALALAASACGGGPGGAEVDAAIAAATANEPQLQRTDGLLTTQFLDTADGAIADLSGVLTGDRPVLLWYWAPN